jgi:Protein of unknown function (DUF3768)
MSKKKERSARIAALNDEFRKGHGGGRYVTTSGVKAESSDFIYRASKAVQNFDAFTEENDPYGEHDFASVTVDGIHLFWKIEYFQKGSDYTEGAEAPENAATTDRVLTIMLAEEY